MLTLVPRPTNKIYQFLEKINAQTRASGWTIRFVDFAYVGSSASDAPVRKMASREELIKALQYAFSRMHIKNIKEFAMVETITPIVLDTGVGLLLESPFIRHLASALGFVTQDQIFIVLATPGKKMRWNQDEFRAAKRMFENPEDGKFHCQMHPSQWNIAVVDKEFSEVQHMVVDLEYMVPEAYVGMKILEGKSSGNVTKTLEDLAVILNPEKVSPGEASKEISKTDDPEHQEEQTCTQPTTAASI